MSWPRKCTCPSKRKPRTKSFRRLRQRKTVLLPQPDGPIKAVILPCSMGIWLSRTARNLPQYRLSILQSIITLDVPWLSTLVRLVGACGVAHIRGLLAIHTHRRENLRFRYIVAVMPTAGKFSRRLLATLRRPRLHRVTTPHGREARESTPARDRDYRQDGRQIDSPATAWQRG